MTIWSADNHIRHPWFDYSAKKRKHSLRDREFSTSSDESDIGETRPAKRARCDALEKGLAHLSLLPSSSTSVVEKESNIEEIEEPGPMVVELLRGGESMGDVDESAVLPSSVEEPERQDIPEVQMKTSSWYEIDTHRIVITDLDSFELEDDNVGEGERSGMTINANLLERFKDQPPLVPRDLLGSSAQSQALVLFRPLPIPNHQILETLEQKDRETEDTRDGESMEVEVGF